MSSLAQFSRGSCARNARASRMAGPRCGTNGSAVPVARFGEPTAVYAIKRELGPSWLRLWRSERNAGGKELGKGAIHKFFLRSIVQEMDCKKIHRPGPWNGQKVPLLGRAIGAEKLCGGRRIVRKRLAKRCARARRSHGFHVRTAPNQDLGSRVQWSRPPVVVVRLDVCTCVRKRLADRRMALLSGPVQRRGLLGVPRIRQLGMSRDEGRNSLDISRLHGPIEFLTDINAPPDGFGRRSTEVSWPQESPRRRPERYYGPSTPSSHRHETDSPWSRSHV